MIADYINNFCLDYVKKHVIFAILMIIIGYKFWYKYILISGIIILLFIIYFFRRPKVNTERSRNYAVSPASGKIIKIQEKEGLLQIAIFINLWDAHVQYSPYDGIVQSQIYKKGQFNAAYLFKKGKDNEKLIHNIRTDRGLMTIVQIAGVVARSIEKFVNKGEQVSQNDELGLIRFGSRCDLFIPIENKFNVLVKEGDRVKGGITNLVQFFDI
jgi:phosphatidylserine decarboxylase